MRNLKSNRPAEAEAFLHLSLALYKRRPECDRPALAETLDHLSVVLTKQGKVAEAAQAVQEAVEALQWCRKSIEFMDPMAINDLAWLMATSGIADLRDGPSAVALAEAAVQGTEKKNASLLDTLAAAYAEAGRYDQAVATQKEAIALLPIENQNNEYAARLKLYEAKTPYRAL